MPTRNVNLPAKLDRFVTEKVEAGLYANASEVMRTALRVLEREEREFEAKLIALRAAIDEGDRSEIDEDGDAVQAELEVYMKGLAAKKEGPLCRDTA
jgi:antitoxin ParD1/3/4